MKTVTTNQGSVKERIIETIDQLRQRKARPDLERISHMLVRKYGLKASETEGHIEKLVDSGDVVKVEYKGSTSYRNGAKWRKHHLGGQVLNSKDVSERIIEAIRSLVAENSVDAKQGVSLEDIESWLVRQKGETHLLNETLEVALNREADIGKMRKLGNGNYSLTLKRGPKPAGMSNSTKTALKRALSDPTGGHSTSAKFAKLSPTPKSPNKSTHSEGAEVGSPKRGRPFSKRKRIKKNHGPDFESYDPAANERRMCDFCLQTEKKRNGQNEDLLVCIDCNAKAHPSCMDYSDSLARRARRAPWQCIDCKTCFICQDAGDPDAMLFCDACDKGYHMKCHIPTITEKPKGKWACAQCVEEGVKFDEAPPIGGQIEQTGKGPLTVQINLDNGSPERTDAEELFSGASCLPTPCDSPITEMSGALLDVAQGRNGHPKQEGLLKTFPTRLRVTNAATWSIDDVMTYISDVGFQEQADNFKEQEIDGQSLLLLRRNDVLTGLSLKLGPALKIYNLVMDVQTYAKTS